MKEEGTFIFKVHQFTKGEELYKFIKKEMTFGEVMELYRLLQKDICGIDIASPRRILTEEELEEEWQKECQK